MVPVQSFTVQLSPTGHAVEHYLKIHPYLETEIISIAGSDLSPTQALPCRDFDSVSLCSVKSLDVIRIYGVWLLLPTYIF